MPSSRKYRVIVVPEATALRVIDILKNTARYEAAGVMVHPDNGRRLEAADKAAYAQAAGRMVTILENAKVEEL